MQSPRGGFVAGADTKIAQLEGYRAYLTVLANVELGSKFRGKLDPSGIVQQTLFEASKRIDEHQGGQDRILPWLRTILACNITDALRTVKRAKRDVAREISMNVDLSASSARLEELLPANQTSPSGKAVRQEMLLRMAQALLQLPENQRKAILLRYGQGWKLEDIAKSMGITPPSVVGLIHRGTKQLRTQMEKGQT